MPSLIRKGLNFTIAYAKWVLAGKPLRADEYIFDLYDNHCSQCPDEAFIQRVPDIGECNECGCWIKRISTNEDTLNKLAWPTEGCPLGHWKADVEDSGQ